MTIQNGLSARGPSVSDGFVFIRDRREVWSDFDSMILFTREQFSSYAEVEQMIEAESKTPTEVYAYDTSFRKRGAHTLIDFWFRFSLWFKRMVSR